MQKAEPLGPRLIKEVFLNRLEDVLSLGITAKALTASPYDLSEELDRTHMFYVRQLPHIFYYTDQAYLILSGEWIKANKESFSDISSPGYGEFYLPFLKEHGISYVEDSQRKSDWIWLPNHVKSDIAIPLEGIEGVVFLETEPDQALLAKVPLHMTPYLMKDISLYKLR